MAEKFTELGVLAVPFEILASTIPFRKALPIHLIFKNYGYNTCP